MFLGPVVLLILAIKANEWREKRRTADEPSRVETTLHEDRAIIAVGGRLDAAAAAELETELAVVAAREIRLAVLDLRNTTSIDEAVTARLVELQDDSRRAGIEWALVGARPAVQLSLELSGITDLASVYDTPETV